VIAGQIVMIVAVDRIMAIALPVGPLAVVIGIETLSNAGCTLWVRRAREVREWMLAVVMLADVVLLTALLSLTGGSFNPFSCLYLVGIALAAVVLRPGWTWVVATVMLATLSPDARVHACDVCAIYVSTEQHESGRGFRVGVAEQFSHFATLQDKGKEIDNPGERLDSSNTQLILGYDFMPRFGVQLTLPVITRHFRRLEGGRLTSGDETGIGDLSLIGIARPFTYVDNRSVVRTTLLGGLKFPTGSAGRLGEESEEGDEHDASGAGNETGPGATMAHHGMDTGGPLGVHGHDLALGSGSVDGLVGGSVFASWDRFFWTTTVQYAIRTEGDFDYRYANDLTWSGGPGVYPYLAHGASVALQAVVSGERKGKDEMQGSEVGDTGITAVYMGPGVRVTWGMSLAADVAADFPLRQDNTGVQIVRDYRIRGGISWRF